MSIKLPRFLLASTLALTGIALTSCVDDSYDIDDLNKDYEIKVTDLVLPVKLDAIELSSVFSLDENSVVKDMGDYYAVEFNGDFKSDEIRIDPVTLNVGQISPINTNIFSYSGTDVTLPSFNVGEQALAYQITPAETPFELAGVSIDNCLRRLDNIKGDFNVHFTFNLTDLNGMFRTLQFQKLKLQLPKGFKAEGYIADEKGCIVIPDFDLTPNGVTEIDLTVSQIDATKLPASEYSFIAGPGSSPSSLSIKSAVGIAGGYIVGITNPTTTSTPQQVDLRVDPRMSDVHVNSISGSVKYIVEDLNIGDLELNGLPDFLTQSGTNISLSNPQLYLNINNPLADYKLNASSGLSLGAIRNDILDKTITLPESSKIVIGFDKGATGTYSFCLAPSKPAELASAVTFLSFPDFGTLLSGDGLPQQIRVNFIDPQVGEGTVTDFKLGQTLAPIKGDYHLTAPLAFNDGSQIVYEERETGWDDETLLKLTVSRLELHATITNPLPCDVIMTGHPLDKNGDFAKDPQTGQPVQLVDAAGNLGFTIKAGTSSDITLRTTGTFNGIDGISYEARCVVTQPGVAMSPKSTIKVENIRAIVSGAYRDSF